MKKKGIIDGILGPPINVEINPNVEVNPNIQIVTPPEITDALLWIKWT